MKSNNLPHIKKLISELIVNKDNYRHDSLKNEKDAIKRFCLDSENKILKLARSIVKNGILSTKIFIIIKNDTDKEKYTVLDGNRRLTVLKILQDPKLIPDETSYLKKYCSKNQQNFNEEEVWCIEYFNEEDASDVIFMEHSGSDEANTQEKWSKIRQIQFKKRFRNEEEPKWYKIIEKNTSKEFFKELETSKLKNKMSTAERIFTNANINKYFSIDEEFKFTNKDSKNILEKILADISKGTINSRKMNTDAQTEKYLNSITKNNIPNGLNKPNTNEKEKIQKNKKNMKEAKYTLGSLRIRIENTKLTKNEHQGIFKLLEEIKILEEPFKKKQLYKQLPLATLSLIRNLYEQSLRFYLQEYCGDIWQELEHKSKKGENFITLNDMVKKILNSSNVIFNKTIDKDFKTFNASSSRAIECLNWVVHKPHLYTGHIEDVERFTSGFIYELLDFILNKQEDKKD